MNDKPACISIEPNQKVGYADSPLLLDPTFYRRLVGRLVYLTIIRHELCYLNHLLSHFMKSPHGRQ